MAHEFPQPFAQQCNPVLLFPSRQNGLNGAFRATTHMDRGGVQQALRQVAADIGLKRITPHCLRHNAESRIMPNAA